MTTRIIIVNEGPEDVEVAVTGKPIFIVAKGTHQADYVHSTQEIHIKEVAK